MLKKYLMLFLVAMVPIVELRGAIPIGVGWNLPLPVCYLICVLGNIVPIPFIVFFGKHILTVLAKVKFVGPFFQKIIDRAEKKAETLGTAEFWGIFIFVAIPLPGTGAWTGSLIAAILRMRVKKAILAVSLGVISSGIIMLLLSVAVKAGILTGINIFG